MMLHYVTETPCLLTEFFFGIQQIGGSSVTFTLTSHTLIVESFRGLVIPTSRIQVITMKWPVFSRYSVGPSFEGIDRMMPMNSQES